MEESKTNKENKQTKDYKGRRQKPYKNLSLKSYEIMGCLSGSIG